jgi:microcystin-dependent protein
MEGYTGEIRLFGGDFAPEYWMVCNGRELKIGEYSMLYTILGDRFGGDRRTVFKLPDFRERRPVKSGAAPGFFNVELGEIGGREEVKLTDSEIPRHSHRFAGGIDVTVEPKAYSQVGNFESPNGNVYSKSDGSGFFSETANISIGSTEAIIDTTNVNLGYAGKGTEAISVLNPYQVLNFIICVEGHYPSR